jgi:hypothetical protein
LGGKVGWRKIRKSGKIEDKSNIKLDCRLYM